jgi:hypothetical protein
MKARDFFHQAKLLLQRNRKWSGLLSEFDEATYPILFSKFGLG